MSAPAAEDSPPTYLGHRQRLRDRFLKSGLESFNDYEVVELLLTLAIPRSDVKQPAKALIAHFGNLRGILDAPLEELQEVSGIGTVAPVALRIIRSAAAMYLQQSAEGAESLADPDRLSTFSSQGPSVEFAIKPDLVAVGENLYMPAQKLDPRGAMYSADGYVLEQGTSFAAPIVAGAAALLKAARPGLSAAQYRSLLVDTAAPASLVPGTTATVQQAGGGRLDVSAALNATAAAVPASVSFGSGAPDVAATRKLVISNVGTAADTFTLSAAPNGTGPAPALQPQSVQLDPGASAEIAVGLTGSALPGGAYEGFILVQGAAAATPIRVPYWYGVPSGTARHITVIYTEPAGRAGASVSDAILFKVTDAAGLPVDNPPIQASAAAPALLLSLRSRNSVVPNAWGINLRLGARAGSNVVHIQVGDVSHDVTVVGH